MSASYVFEEKKGITSCIIHSCQLLDVSPLISKIRFYTKFPNFGRGRSNFLGKKCGKHQCDCIIWMSHLQLVWCLRLRFAQKLDLFPLSEVLVPSGERCCASHYHTLWIQFFLFFFFFAIWEEDVHLKQMFISLKDVYYLLSLFQRLSGNGVTFLYGARSFWRSGTSAPLYRCASSWLWSCEILRSCVPIEPPIVLLSRNLFSVRYEVEAGIIHNLMNTEKRRKGAWCCCWNPGTTGSLGDSREVIALEGWFDSGNISIFFV